MNRRFIYLLLFYFLPISLFSQVKVGAEQTELYFPFLKGKRIAVCANQTSMVGEVHLIDTLIATEIDVVKIFSPEHGFRGDAEAGALINSSRDRKTGIEIVSLYGKNKKPTHEQMQNIDLLIFDIQDVGCRFYTYISTLHYLMEAAAESQIPLLILDRPNPNGYYVAGPVLKSQFTSFVGMHPIPIVHGMTIAEYAQMINGEKWLKNKDTCQLYFVLVENYTHQTRYSLPIPPSPNLQTDEAINLYPSLCLFEGTGISVGRGTSTPFQIYGAPELKAGEFYFTPKSIKGVAENPPHLEKKCRGENLTAIADSNLSLLKNDFTLSYLIQAYQNYPDKSLFFNRPDFFDKLMGNSTVRQMILDGKNEKEIEASWQDELEEFELLRKKYLLYNDSSE